ncbi:MAG: type II toxin-antitoxin system Phd/YefM family antitoxin [Microthrixaceae bacterium]
MVSVTASEARKRFAHIIKTAQQEAVIVERRGEAQAVVVSPAEYARLMSAEEVDDMAASDAAMSEEGRAFRGAGQGRLGCDRVT